MGEGSKVGRPTDYSPELIAIICNRIADGESLRRICRDEAMPDRVTVWRWLDLYPEFSNQYARAREMQAEFYAEEMLEISDTPLKGTKTVTKANGVEVTEGDMIEHRRLQIDTRKWIAARMAPKKYGDPGKMISAEIDREDSKPRLIDKNADIP